MGCATSAYRVLNSGEYGTELNVSPDRVLLECERLHDADEPGLSGFMMHVLDENDTVLTLVQGKGVFHNNGRVLGFVAIANEFGSCYDAYSGEEKPCPRDPFPLKNKK